MLLVIVKYVSVGFGMGLFIVLGVITSRRMDSELALYGGAVLATLVFLSIDWWPLPIRHNGRIYKLGIANNRIRPKPLLDDAGNRHAMAVLGPFGRTLQWAIGLSLVAGMLLSVPLFMILDHVWTVAEVDTI